MGGPCLSFEEFMRNLIALVVVTAVVGIALSACTPDIVNEINTSAVANPNNSSNSESSNDLENSQGQGQDQEQEQEQDQDQTIST
jgi:hypothetical protein